MTSSSASRPLRRTRQALPRGEQASEHRGLDRFHLAAQLRERAAADLAEDAGLAPFALRAAGTEIAFEQAAYADQPPQHGFDDGSAETEAAGDVGGGERAVRARVAHQQIAERIAHGRQQRFRQPVRQRRAERITIAGGILDGDEARLAGNRQLHRAAFADELSGESRGGAAARRHLECVGDLGEDIACPPPAAATRATCWPPCSARCREVCCASSVAGRHCRAVAVAAVIPQHHPPVVRCVLRFRIR